MDKHLFVWFLRSICSLAIVIFSNAAVARAVPPVRETIDVSGVDLLTGRMTATYHGPSIGAGRGLGFTRHYGGPGSAFWDGHIGAIRSVSSVYLVTLNGRTEKFSYAGGIFTPLEQRGASLTYSTGTYTYTTNSGAVAIFQPKTAQYGYPTVRSRLTSCSATSSPARVRQYPARRMRAFRSLPE